MDEPYQVFEPADLPGEVVLVGERDTLPEAIELASGAPERTIEQRDGGTARVIEYEPAGE